MSDKRISQLVERVSIANNDVLPIVALNAATTNKVTISTIQDWMQTHLDHGVTSIGITIGSTGTDISVSGSPVTAAGNITINVPTSSAANRGLLSAADWTTFNNKVGTARSINTTAPLQGGGDLSANRTLSITQAGVLGDGYLSSVDWNTFNNKQPALGYTPVNQTRELTINGTTYNLSADRTWNVGTVTSIGVSMPSAFTVSNSPITGAGTIAITGAGNSTQYIDGTGSLQTFPSIVGNATNLIREVYNDSGATMTKGTIVYINGGQGNLPTIAKALATGDSTSAQTYGVVREDIGNMSNGYITVVGDLLDMSTNGFAVGTQLYLSGTTAGAFTSTKPYAPIHLVYVGIVTRSHPTQGVIAIKIQNGYEMDELHNVAAHLPNDGDILKYVSSTGLWTKTAGSTTNITEGTNLYYTDARARSAFSETVTGLDYNSSTGVLSTSAGYGIPTTASQTNWDAAYNDKINSAAVTGTTTKTLTLTQQDGGTITASWTDINTDAVSSVFGRTGAIVAIAGDYNTDLVTEGTTNLYFTNARARSAISLTTTGSSGAATYSAGVLNVPNYTLSGLGGEPAITAGTTAQYWRGDKTWQTLNTTNVAEGTSLYFTNARSRSSISLTTTGTSGAATYDSATGVLNIPSYVGGVTSVFGRTGAVVAASGDYTTTQVTEGTNLYFTDARARAAISLTTTGTSGAATYSAGVFNIPNYSLSGLGGVPTSRTLTIQGTALDLSADRSWDIYTIYSTGLGTATMNVNYGSSYVLRNENGLGGVLSYAPLFHCATGDTMWQIQGTYGSTGDGSMYFRQGYNGSWGNWITMLSSSNYSSYAVPTTRTITINGVAQNLTANRSWTVGNVTGSGTTNRIAYWDSASSIGFLDTASYPSLTELGYVKGVTSAIQTQLNSKQASLSDPIYFNGAVSTPGYAGANYDALTGSAYYRLNGGGDSRGVLVLNTGGSLGTLQLEASYNEGLRFRNKTDNANWNGFKRIIDTGNYRGLLAGGTISHDVLGDAVTWRIQNDNTGGYSTSMAFSVYGYTAPAAYFDVLRIQGSYPGFGRANFIVKNQSNSTELVALYMNGDGNTYSNYSITAASSMSSPTFANSTGYPYNTDFGQGADAAFSRLMAGSTSGYRSSVTVYGGSSPAGGNQIIMQTASANRLTIDNTYTYVLNNLMNEKYHRINGEDGAKRYEIIRGFDTGAVDEYWIRVELPQYYYQQNSNDGKIVLEVQWNSVHASYHAYTKLEFNYHAVYWKSPSQLGLSNLKRTYTPDFGGGTYYAASSQPRVDIYEKNDGYFYIRVKGNTIDNNLNQRKTLRLNLLGKVGVEPTITMGVAAPTGGSYIPDSYSLDSNSGNLYLLGDIENNSQVIGRGSTSAYSGTSYSGNYSLFLRANGLSTNGGDNDYSGIRFSNRNGSREQFFGVVQVASNRGDWVWQSYTGTQYQEGMRLYGNTHTLEVRGDVIAYGSPSDLRLKTIKEKVPNALDKIMRLNGYRFDWNRASDTSDIKEDIGVIAQEVIDVFPELARTNDDGYMSVRYQGLTAVLIEAIKEQQKQIDELKKLIK